MKIKFPGKKRIRTMILLFVTIALAVFIYEFRIVSRVLFAVREWRHEQEWKSKSLWLPEYRLVLRKEVAGITRNLSGLTWNNETKTLFAVINKPTLAVELSTEGELLRSIVLHGFHDTEAIEHVGGNKFIIAEERRQKLTLATIDADTSEIHAQGLQRITLGIGETGNSGVEGLAWDFASGKLYAAKERFPMHIYEISGFPQAPNATMDIDVAVDRDRDGKLFVADISGLDFNGDFQHLLVLSDASKLVIEIDRNGQPISTLSLISGHGLPGPVPQAEGIALDDENTLYLVSEPNLFYVLRRIPRE